MLKPKTNMLFKSLSNSGSMELMYRVYNSKVSSEQLKIESGLTRKQYYSRMNLLMKEGVVRRKNGMYAITSFGKIIMLTLAVQEKAVNMRFQLKALDTILEDKSMPEQVKTDMIAQLVPDTELQRMLIK